MPLLNDADDLRRDGARVREVRLGDHLVWPARLIDTAVWRVDAGHLTEDGDGLADLSGGGRHAMFGGTATTLPVDDPIGGIEPDPDLPTTQPVEEEPLASARPVVLPWDGEDYLHIPAAGQGARITTTEALPYTATRRDGSTVTGTTPAGEWLFDTPGDWADLRTDGGAYILDPAYVSADYATIANTGTAGGTWNITRATSGYKTAVVDRPLLLFGGAQYAAPADDGYFQSITEQDYTVLLGTRGVWTSAAGVSSGTLLSTKDVNVSGGNRGFIIRRQGTNLNAQAVHRWGTTGETGAGSYNQQYPRWDEDGEVWWMRVAGGMFDTVDTDLVASPAEYMTGQSPLYIGAAGTAAASNGEFEFFAAAIFDRALTDDEVELATLSLLDAERS